VLWSVFFFFFSGIIPISRSGCVTFLQSNHSDLGGLKTALACAFDSAAYVRNLTVTASSGTVTRSSRRLEDQVYSESGAKLLPAAAWVNFFNFPPSPQIEGGASARAGRNSGATGRGSRALSGTTYTWSASYFTWSSEAKAATLASSIQSDYANFLTGNNKDKTNKKPMVLQSLYLL
jgi:hypothetical protein